MTMTTPAGQPGPLQPGEWVSASQPSVVSFSHKDLGPPVGMYVRPEDSILVTHIASAGGGGTIRMFARILRADGVLTVSLIDIPITADSTAHTFQQQLPEGFLLAVKLTSNTSVQRGQLYLQVTLNRGQNLSAGTLANDLLCSGYITAFGTLGYPGGRQDNSVDGPGAIITIQQANPAAGADWAYAVGSQRRQRIQAVNAMFVTSVAVANRQVEVIVDDGVNIVWATSVPANIPASTTAQISLTGSNVAAGIVTNNQTAVLPPGLVLTTNMRIHTNTLNIQAADQWSAIWLLLEDWISN